ncbi:MAG: glycosyltransferase family 9 protein [Acidiphilium sp.]|nr:glycosyltransferase family 9 protein [Acidiphilium sp.]MDD4936190.1 glycosyltransferase family 9 protein [Acidiphilium sp.]
MALGHHAPLKRVLVIRHGALGDIVLSFAGFAAIRAAHEQADITLLTTAPFAAWMAPSPWFDHVTIDAKPSPWDVAGLIRLRRSLMGFDRVYDLQTSSRSSRYYRLAGSPQWSGIAPGCDYPHANPARDTLHSRERIAEQLAMAGIATMAQPDLTWLRTAPPPLALPDRFIALIPGTAPHRPEKRWPAARFGALAASLGMPTVIFGTKSERDLAAAIEGSMPGAIDLTGRTTLPQLAAALSRAGLAIGNDTGPMHLAAALGIPSIVLFGGTSDPALTAPRAPDGAWPTIIRAASLADLPVATVAQAVAGRHNHPSLMP